MQTAESKKRKRRGEEEEASRGREERGLQHTKEQEELNVVFRSTAFETMIAAQL